ncbi:MAG: type II toxin-antitoxin system Phd/YefM family antitoxin [Epsilonproteobacteria bacterium]|nr:type II toxin-antitoxin system Phd/YefM family antitoxin [Campylobacterota bacterium]
MVAYTQNELVSATEISKQFGEYISKVKDGLLDKIGILKNNKLNAVILSVEEYEQLVLSRNKLEEMEMYQEIHKRKQTPKEEYLDGGDVLKRLNLSLDD